MFFGLVIIVVIIIIIIELQVTDRCTGAKMIKMRLGECRCQCKDTLSAIQNFWDLCRSASRDSTLNVTTQLINQGVTRDLETLRRSLAKLVVLFIHSISRHFHPLSDKSHDDHLIAISILVQAHIVVTGGTCAACRRSPDAQSAASCLSHRDIS